MIFCISNKQVILGLCISLIGTKLLRMIHVLLRLSSQVLKLKTVVQLILGWHSISGKIQKENFIWIGDFNWYFIK